jgi:hypothetical protein
MPSVVIYRGCKFRLSLLLLDLHQAENEEESSKHRWGVLARVGWGCENEWNEFARNCMQYSFETSCNLTWAAFNVMYYGFLCH